MKARFRYFAFAAGLVLTLGFTGCSRAQDAGEIGITGEWLVTLDKPGQPGFRLQVESADSGLSVFADGSPIEFVLNGDEVRFVLDIYDGGDALRHDTFSGIFDSGSMSGQYIPEYDGIPGVPGAPVAWSAVPYQAREGAEGLMLDPSKLQGFWVVRERGIKKAIRSYSDAGQALVDAYLDMDDPINRCVNPGLLRTLRARPGATAVDIFYQEPVLKIDYQNAIGNAQRTIFLDGREFPEEIAPNFMGYSIGRVEGDVLVVETRGFKPMFYDSNGAPVSPDAKLVERYWLDGEGMLQREYVFDDPVYYERELFNRGSLIRRENPVVETYDCDPHLFYRNLDITGELDTYFRRARSWRN